MGLELGFRFGFGFGFGFGLELRLRLELGIRVGVGIEVGATLVNLLLKLVHPCRLPLLVQLHSLEPIGLLHLPDKLLRGWLSELLEQRACWLIDVPAARTSARLLGRLWTFRLSEICGGSGTLWP